MDINEIWVAYRTSLRTFLLSKVADPDDVDDLLQDTLIKINSNLDGLKDQSSIKAWLFQIANRTVIDFYRKKGRHTAQQLENLWHGESEQKVQDDLVKCLEPFIAQLSEEEQDLIRAIDLEGVAQKLLAERLGVSYSTLKSRVQKVRSKLLRLFEQCCDFSRDTQGNLMDFQQKSSALSKACKSCD